MLASLFKDRPKVTFVFIVLSFIGAIVSKLYPKFYELMVLDSSALSAPQKWYQFVTYPLVIIGLVNWLVSSIVLFLFGKVVEKYLSVKEVILLMLVSTIVGGLAFFIFNDFKGSIDSVSLMSWGMGGVVIVFGFRNWYESESLERTTLIIIPFLIIWQLITFNPPVFFSQCVLMTLSALLASIRYKKKSSQSPSIEK